MIKINEANYDYYKKVATVLWRFQARLANIDPDVDYSPVNVLTNWEQESKSLAIGGLKEGLRDTLTDIMDLPAALKEEVNVLLKNEGLPNLSRLLSEIKSIPANVLKRGKIKNIDEYYVIKEVLADVTYEMSSSDRDTLETLFNDFENRAAR